MYEHSNMRGTCLELHHSDHLLIGLGCYIFPPMTQAKGKMVFTYSLQDKSNSNNSVGTHSDRCVCDLQDHVIRTAACLCPCWTVRPPAPLEETGMLLSIAPSATQCRGAPRWPTASTLGSRSPTNTPVSLPTTNTDVSHPLCTFLILLLRLLVRLLTTGAFVL